ncbi:LysR family transcriptional regulator [Yersinia enterocolitica]|uniref:LysR family transcriptional regulator n=1 Tax=Yersinia enterocolitica TaxID=630 RepID=UPI0029BD3214|nr:LysR family transcriptional regulator [Yersinia enterocolitica]HEI6814784.1 LysR family transcriptional regulator [Yersinia enterocolitica]
MFLLSKSLRYFIITAQEESIQSAASRLFITASPLCRTIKSFEDNIGHKLFSRTKHGMKLTSYGNELYKQLIPIYQQVSLIEESYSSKEKITLPFIKDFKIGFDHQYYSYLSIMLSSNFFKSVNFNVSLEYYLPNEVNIEEIFRRNLCYVFFSCNYYDTPPQIVHFALPSEPFKLAVAMKNIVKDVSPKSYLSSNALVCYDNRSLEPTWKKVDEFLKINGFNPRKISVPNINDQLSMIENGDAIGIVPESVQTIITARNYNVILLNFTSDENPIHVVRHMYFSYRNKQIIERSLLPLWDDTLGKVDIELSDTKPCIAK